MTRECTCAPHYSEHPQTDQVPIYSYTDTTGAAVTLTAFWHGTADSLDADYYTVRIHGGGHFDRRITCFQWCNATEMFDKIVAALKESRPLPWWIGDHQ